MTKVKIVEIKKKICPLFVLALVITLLPISMPKQTKNLYKEGSGPPLKGAVAFLCLRRVPAAEGDGVGMFSVESIHGGELPAAAGPGGTGAPSTGQGSDLEKAKFFNIPSPKGPLRSG